MRLDQVDFFLEVDRVTGRLTRYGGVSGLPGSEGVSESPHSSSSESRKMGDPSSSELLELLSSSSALLFVHASSRRCCSWLADPGVERLTGFTPVPVVGMASASGPPSAQSCRFAISFVLRTGIGSCSSGSGRVGGGVTKLAVGAGVVLGPAPGVPACSG